MNTDDEKIVHVFKTGETWSVKPKDSKETTHKRKAVAALFAKQLANSHPHGRVIFLKSDGSVEVECVYHRPTARALPLRGIARISAREAAKRSPEAPRNVQPSVDPDTTADSRAWRVGG